MIILDTNVISEVMRPEPAARVTDWLAGQLRSSLYVTSLSYAEIRFGLALMPASKRREALTEQATGMFTEDFAGRVLDFTSEMASVYGAIASDRQQAGHRIGPMDGLIAAIARTHGAAIATRDRDFTGCGVTVINPWDEV